MFILSDGFRQFSQSLLDVCYPGKEIYKLLLVLKVFNIHWTKGKEGKEM